MATGVGLRIKERRNSLMLSQEALAKRMGLKSKSTICKIERGEDNLTTDTIAKYATALCTSPAYLMGWVSDPDPSYADTLEGKSEELQSKFSVVENAVVGDVDEFQSITSSMTKDELVSAVHLFEEYQKAPADVQSVIERLLKSSQSDS